jgi:acetyl esterase/lipase
VLIHGGFWRRIFTKRLMNSLARAVTDRGWLAWNIEYRRGGQDHGGGWPNTFADVASAIDHLADLGGVDLDRVVTCGHSAGGHLALWAAGRGRLPANAPGGPARVRTRGAMSLAGVVDLEAAATLGLGDNAVQALMGGEAATWPERYRLASPKALLPLGVPQVLIHGLADTTVPPAMSEAYQAAAAALGDQATYVPLPGVGHRELIDARKAPWETVAAHLTHLLS